MDNLSQKLIDFAVTEGACAAGIATLETLSGGPPSADLTYIRPDAKSAVSFAVPLDDEMIIPFLKKELAVLGVFLYLLELPFLGVIEAKSGVQEEAVFEVPVFLHFIFVGNLEAFHVFSL